MSNFYLQIFKSITWNHEYHYHEIKMDEQFNNFNLVLSNAYNCDGTKICIKSINIEELFNSSLHDGLKKLTIERNGFNSSKITILSNLPLKLKKLKLVYVKLKLDNLPLEL